MMGVDAMELGRTLGALRVGESGVVRKLRLDGAMRRRLLELGLVPGTRAECLLRAPSGSPAAYLVRGAVIALRQCDAARVEIGCAVCG